MITLFKKSLRLYRPRFLKKRKGFIFYLVAFITLFILALVNSLINIGSSFDYSSALLSGINNKENIIIRNTDDLDCIIPDSFVFPSSDSLKSRLETSIDAKLDKVLKTEMDKYAFIVDDDSIEEGTCSVDYGTYMSCFSNQKELLFETNFSKFKLPISSSYSAEKGIYISSRTIADLASPYLLSSLDLVGSINKNDFNSPKSVPTVLSCSTFNEKYGGDLDISNSEIFFNSDFFNTYKNNTVGNKIYFPSASDLKIKTGYEDKILGMSNLFPSGLELERYDGINGMIVAVVSDENYQRIVDSIDPFSYALGTKFDPIMRQGLKGLLDKGEYEPYVPFYTDESTRILMVYNIYRVALNAFLSFLRIIAMFLFLSSSAYFSYYLFKDSRREITQAEMLGEGKIKASFPFIIRFALIFLLSVGLSYLCSFFIINFINRNSLYWFSELGFSKSSFLTDLSELILFIVVFCIVWVAGFILDPLRKRIRDL